MFSFIPQLGNRITTRSPIANPLRDEQRAALLFQVL
jgi:hypothetical protein